MRLLRRRRASSASAFPIARPKALNANASRKSAGSATARSGAPDARGASALSNGDTVSAVAVTRELSEWIAGSASASSPITSSTSAALWNRRRSLNEPCPPSSDFKPAGHPRRALLCPALLTTTPKTSILRRKVANPPYRPSMRHDDRVAVLELDLVHVPGTAGGAAAQRVDI